MGRRKELSGVEDAYLALEKEIKRLTRALAAVGGRKTRKKQAKASGPKGRK
jgi:hypothetical protein